MNKKHILLIILLFFAQISIAQLFPYDPREWETNWATTEFSDYFNGTISIDTNTYYSDLSVGKIFHHLKTGVPMIVPNLVCFNLCVL